MLEILPYLVAPSIVLISVSLIATWWMPNYKISSALQHLAAGIIFATVATELVPELLQSSSVIMMLIGYGAGMLLILCLRALDAPKQGLGRLRICRRGGFTD